MDPATVALVSKVGAESAEILKKESESFLSAVLGEPAKALGGILADKINARRHANLIKITAEAERNLVAARRAPSEIPLKIIHPALEAASLEQDETLQHLWAGLLATAAMSEGPVQVRPAFIAILKQMSPDHAVLLDWLADHPVVGNEPVTLGTLHEEFVADTGRGITPAIFRSSLEELAASELIYLSPLATRVHNSFASAESALTTPMREPYSVTHRGIEFVRACRAPSAETDCNSSHV